jgi:hypothetical protein
MANATPSSKKPKAKVKKANNATKVKNAPTTLHKSKAVKSKVRDFLGRRPHRSFRRTLRRDYVRSLELPGYIAFTKEVFVLLKNNMRTFVLLILLFSLFSSLLVGFASQETYRSLGETLNNTSQNIFSGAAGEVSKAGLLLITSLNGSLSGESTDIQQVYAIFIFLLVWLTTVWLLRAILAGQRPNLRHAIYSSGAPIVSTFIILLILLLQAIPAALAVIAYSAALTTDFLSNPLISIVFFFIALLLILLSVYLLISSFFAMIVVTLPGMYPWKAIRTAGDMVTGRRLRILLRMAWLMFVIALAWFIIMLPLILLTNWIQAAIPQVAWVPVIPILLVILSTSTTVIAGTYVYLLYRKVLEDESAPA